MSDRPGPVTSHLRRARLSPGSIAGTDRPWHVFVGRKPSGRGGTSLQSRFPSLLLTPGRAGGPELCGAPPAQETHRLTEGAGRAPHRAGLAFSEKEERVTTGRCLLRAPGSLPAAGSRCTEGALTRPHAVCRGTFCFSSTDQVCEELF